MRKLYYLFAYVIHLALGTVVAMYSAEFTAGLLSAIQRFLSPGTPNDWIVRLVFGPFYVLQIATAATLGVSSVKIWKPHVAPFVFVPPLLFLIFRLVTWSPPSLLAGWSASGVVSHFFGSSCQPPSCWDQVFITLPAYTSAAYAGVSWLRQHKTASE